MEEKNGNRILLSIKDLVVKFHVRGRTLTAIRGISLDILENESIAIVGESGSGKSVFTKTFAGMLDSNGFIDQGKIIFDDEELADTKAALNRMGRWLIRFCNRSLDRSARLEAGAETWQKILDLDAELRRAATSCPKPLPTSYSTWPRPSTAVRRLTAARKRSRSKPARQRSTHTRRRSRRWRKSGMTC